MGSSQIRPTVYIHWTWIFIYYIHKYAYLLIFLSAQRDRCATVAPNSSAIRHVSSSLCGDHGKCVNDHMGGFTCVCDAGYTGRYCHESMLIYSCKN